jgi:hypothetical protein
MEVQTDTTWERSGNEQGYKGKEKKTDDGAEQGLRMLIFRFSGEGCVLGYLNRLLSCRNRERRECRTSGREEERKREEEREVV